MLQLGPNKRNRGTNLDAAADDVNERFPLEVLGVRPEAVPFACESLCAVRVLLRLDLARLVVPTPRSDRRTWDPAGQTNASRNAQKVSIRVLE